MSAYATPSQVQALIHAAYKSGFSADTAPTTTQLDALLLMVAAEINVHLGSVGFDVPVVTPATFAAWLGLVNAEGVAAIALKALAPGSQSSSNGGPVVPAYAFYEKRYQDALKMIDKRDLTFPGVSVGNAVLSSTYLMDNPDNDPLTDGFTSGQQPRFSIGSNLREF